MKRYALALIGLILFSSGLCIFGEAVISKYEKRNMKEREIIREILRNEQTRKFLRNVYNRESYNNFLHSQMNGEEYVFQKKTKEYKVNPDVSATSTPEHDLLRWGLYPQQVVF